MSLERDLLDTEPMKELSSKRPLVCSEVNGQPVLLKVSLNSDLWKFQKYKGSGELTFKEEKKPTIFKIYVD
jgi:hypothetical protein